MEFERWNYPQVDTPTSQQLSADELEQEAAQPEPSPEEVRREQEHLAHLQTLTEQTTLIRDIGQQWSNTLNNINETLLTTITRLIKQVAEKVILKELALDEERMATIIKQALATIQNDNEPCTIHIAAEQLPHLTENASFPSDITFKPDPALKPGEFRIKTVCSELEAILENRLNELFGVCE